MILSFFEMATISPGLKRVIILSAGGVAAALVLRRSFTKSLSDESGKPEVKAGTRRSDNQARSKRDWKRILQLIALSRDSHAMKILAAMFGCAFVFAVVDVRKAFVSGQLFRAVFEGDKPQFKRLLGLSVGLCLVLTVFNKILANLVSSLGRHWHWKLVRGIHELYFKGNNYYKIQNVIELPHERIATDVPQLTRDLALISCDLVNSLINFLVFSRQVFIFGKRIAGDKTWSGARLVLGPVTYAVVGSYIVSKFVPNLAFVKRRQRELESKYKQAHVRLCRNAESVALYKGEKYEEAVVKKHFTNLTRFNEAVRWSGLPSELVKEYITKYCLHTAMITLVLLPFFNPLDSSKGKNSGQTMYRIRVLSELIIMELIALSQIARLGSTVQRVGGLVNRVGELVSELDDLSVKAMAPDMRGTTNDNSIVFDKVTINTPTGHRLVTDLSFTIRPGENFLLCGPNGSGKSSIFRCLGGLWPIESGQVLRPAGDGSGLHSMAFYLPQKPYTVFGTLVQNITYPKMDAKIEHVQLSALLRLVELDYLLKQGDETGITDAIINWESRLSLGEQQRLAMARLFWHRPTYAVLDECTSAVSLKMERRLFKLCRELGITLITISHRPALQDFHDRMLVLDGSGGYKIQSLPKKNDTSLLHSMSTRSLSDFQALLGNYPFDKIVSRLERSGSIAVFNLGHASSSEEDESDMQDMVQLVPARGASASVDSIKIWKASAYLVRTCWNLHDVWRAGVVLGVVIIRTYISNSLAGMSGDSFRYLLKGKHSSFIKVIGTTLLMGFLQALFMPMLDVMEGDLGDAWRRRITKAIMDKYLENKKYYDLSVDGGVQRGSCMSNIAETSHECVLPHQVIVDDVDNLTKSIANLWSECAKPSVDFLWFSSSVYALTGWRGLGSLAVYMVGGTGFLNYVRPNLAVLSAQKEQLDGEFLQAHARLSQCSESVAFLEGGNAELGTVQKYLDAKLDHQTKQKRVEHIYGVADQFVTYFLPQSASWILSMMYKSSCSDATGDILIRDLRYLGSVVNQCFGSLGVLVQLGSMWATTRGHLKRVALLVERLELYEDSVTDPSISANSLNTETGHIRLTDVDIVPPSGDLLLVRSLNIDLDAKLERGMIVTGQNGKGKSSVLKCMHGLIKPRKVRH